jgi:hypothetical protein
MSLPRFVFGVQMWNPDLACGKRRVKTICEL